MAVSTGKLRRRIRLNAVLVGVSIVTALLAGLPIAAAILDSALGNGPRTATAFASAPGGHYAVYTNAGVDADEIVVAPSENPSDAMVVATIERLPGYTSRGTVSPDGKKLALVTVDSGTPSQPVASLQVLNLETGELTRAASEIDHLQTPLWTADSKGVLVTRGGDNAPGAVTVYRADSAGDGESLVRRHEAVLGVYPVAFDPEGRLVTVVIDGEGSHVFRDGTQVRSISPYITRDWDLSPDGTALAFVETNLADGTRYLPKVAGLDAGSHAMAQSVASGVQALGAAWAPGDSQGPAFGYEPSAPAGASGGVLAQTLGEDGFDVPLAYSNDGSALAVQHWTGSEFSRPGQASIEIVTGDGRAALPDATRFYGWAAR